MTSNPKYPYLLGTQAQVMKQFVTNRVGIQLLQDHEFAVVIDDKVWGRERVVPDHIVQQMLQAGAVDPLDMINQLLADIASQAPKASFSHAEQLTPADILDEADDDVDDDDEDDDDQEEEEVAEPIAAPAPRARRRKDHVPAGPDPEVDALVQEYRAYRSFGLQEAAAYLGYTSKTQISTLRQRGEFPQPAEQLGCGPIWIKAQLDHFKGNFVGQTRLTQEQIADIVTVISINPLSSALDEALGKVHGVAAKYIAKMRRELVAERDGQFVPDTD